MFENNKIRGRIVEIYGTMSAFEEALGLSQGRVSAKLKDGQLRRDEIFHWSEMLRIPVAEIPQYFFIPSNS